MAKRTTIAGARRGPFGCRPAREGNVNSADQERPSVRFKWLVRPIAALCIAMGVVSLPVAMAAASPVVGGLALSTHVLPPSGGAVTVSASINGGSSCTLSSTPAMAGLPVTFACASSGTFHVHRKLMTPPNAGSSPIHYSIKLVSIDSGGTGSSSKSSALEVEAYKFVSTTLTVPSSATATGVSCLNTSTCDIVGTKGYSAVLAGRTVKWSKGNGADLLAVSCAPGVKPFCAAITPTGVTSKKASGLKKTTELTEWKVGNHNTSISCVGETTTGANRTTDVCVAVDDGGIVYLLRFGTKMLVTHWLTSLTGPAFAACASASACTVVDAAGSGIAYNGTTVTAPSIFDASGGVSGMSCAVDGTCELADSHGSMYSFIAKPKTSVRIPITDETPPPPTPGRMVSCIPHYCLSVATDGTLYQRVNGLWASTNKGKIVATDRSVGISCASGSKSPVGALCVIVGQGGSGTSERNHLGHIVIMK